MIIKMFPCQFEFHIKLSLIGVLKNTNKKDFFIEIFILSKSDKKVLRFKKAFLY